mgnify:FL=1
MKEFAKFASLLALSFTLASGLHAQDAPEKLEDAPAPEQGVIVQEDGSRLIAWVSVREAYEVAITRRANLTKAFVEEEGKLKELADGEEKSALEAAHEKTRQSLVAFNLYLKIVFAPDVVSEYGYDREKDAVYQRIGTPAEIFVKLIARRGLLEKAMEEETDDAKRTQYAADLSLLRNALLYVYGIDPSKNYVFNSDEGIIYLKVDSEEEAKEVLKK